MSKTNLIIAGAIIAIVLIGGITAYVKANEGTNLPFWDKAKIMKQAISDGVISQENADGLKDYMQNKKREMMQKKMEEKLNDAVENDIITKNEAQEIRDWYDSRPEAMKKLKPMMGQKMRKGMRPIPTMY